jgi:hypothetical protein
VGVATTAASLADGSDDLVSSSGEGLVLTGLSGEGEVSVVVTGLESLEDLSITEGEAARGLRGENINGNLTNASSGGDLEGQKNGELVVCGRRAVS